MDIKLIIESAENQYKQILEDFFISVYNEEALSSHGLAHHRRVWNYSKDIIGLGLLKPNEVSLFVTNLIIAAYLHDIGMTIDPGVKHGKHSKVLCQNFFLRNDLSENDFPGLLEAIENHDDKDYVSGKNPGDLLKVLSAADDLDAFGYIGIFRYSEIYLTRGITMHDIGNKIIQNATRRFENFVFNFEKYTDFIKEHEIRYNILYDFFRSYNMQLPSYHFGTGNPAGHCGIVELFACRDVACNVPICDDPIINQFFKDLRKEIL